MLPSLHALNIWEFWSSCPNLYSLIMNLTFYLVIRVLRVKNIWKYLSQNTSGNQFYFSLLPFRFLLRITKFLFPRFRTVSLTCFLCEMFQGWVFLEWLRWGPGNESFFLRLEGTASVILWPLTLASSWQRLTCLSRITRPAIAWHPRWSCWMQAVTR